MESRASVPQQESIREHRLCLSEAGNFGGNGATSGCRTHLSAECDSARKFLTCSN